MQEIREDTDMRYEELEMEVILFERNDVIVTSPDDAGDIIDNE